MIKIKNLTKINETPVNEFNVIKKLFFFKKYSNSNLTNQFVSLRNINLEIVDNEKVFIIGKPGSGKSSLFSVLSKKVDYDYGQLMISNNMFSSTLIRIPPNLITGLKIKDYVKTIMSFILKNEIDNINKLSVKVFEIMNLDKSDQEKSFYEFDIFFFRRLMIAISVYAKAKTFLFDNFNFNLQDKKFQNIFHEYLDKNKNSNHLFFGSKKLDFIRKYASKILILDKGEVFKFEDQQKISDEEIKFYTKSDNDEEEFLEDDDEI
tara:strand:- start:89 stop:877 length:789 start_codon:yes stop_codon:yes gene_type:complete